VLAVLGYASSIFMGLSLGMIGGGGSILTVPILVYLFKQDPMLATAYSLFIVGITALVGGIQAFLNGQVDLKKGTIFAIPGFLGVYATRAYVVPSLPRELFKLGEFVVTKSILVMFVFAFLMVLASYSMIKPSKSSTETDTQSKKKTPYFLIALEGLIVGGVTGFVGAGGGFLIIPALVILTGMPMKIAIGTSLMIIASKSLLGFIGDLQTQPFIDWLFLLQIAGIAIVGLFLGAKLKSKLPEHTLKKGFGWFVLIMGMIVLIDQLSAFFK
jgi:uncharacterized membrane protein YfcA